MAMFQSVPKSVEAVPIRDEMTITTADGKTISGGPGDWFITDENGKQQILPHEKFAARYRPANRNANQVLDRVARMVAEELTSPPDPLSVPDEGEDGGKEQA